ncbi:MAG: hypothetical protein CMP59_05445 [Flavobacteriales bacterium]|nr:hypothetical protein [Flavobacteriales bacterium]
MTITTVSCSYGEGDWGATVGDCDEICTVYYTAQRELMKEREISDRNFPDQEIRRNHVEEIENGHKIKSWFDMVDEKGDTTRKDFSCEIYYDPEVIGYVVKNLKLEN